MNPNLCIGSQKEVRRRKKLTSSSCCVLSRLNFLSVGVDRTSVQKSNSNKGGKRILIKRGKEARSERPESRIQKRVVVRFEREEKKRREASLAHFNSVQSSPVQFSSVAQQVMAPTYYLTWMDGRAKRRQDLRSVLTHSRTDRGGQALHSVHVQYSRMTSKAIAPVATYARPPSR